MNKLVKIFLLIIPLPIFGQNQLLDDYISLAFKQNIVLNQKNITVEKALLSLQSAQNLYQPNISFQGGYQTGEGGRSIGFPIGDILNPVYSTLNALTKTNNFPQINNVETNFFPRNFYDMKLVTTVPILNKDIAYNKELQVKNLVIQKVDYQLYKRELVKNIKSAYFTYLQALSLVKIFQNSLVIAEEGKKMNEKLISNGKGLPVYLYRSISEIAQIQSQIADAKKQVDASKMYFNFLINNDLNQDINASMDLTQEIIKLQKSRLLTSEKREEIDLLEKSVDLQKTRIKMNQSFYLPKLNGYLNVGSQSSNWMLNGKSSYYFLGMQIDIPIYGGKRNLIKIKESEKDLDFAQKTLENSTKQISLATEMALKNLSSSIVAFEASKKQSEAANAYQDLILKGYFEGVNTYIESIDARNQWTNSQLNYYVNQLKVILAHVHLEREKASYPL